MNQKNANKIATALLIYAIVNALIGFFVFASLIDDSSVIAASLLSTCITFSFFIYALGKIIQLLQDIKDESRNASQTIQRQFTDNNNLPSIYLYLR